MDAVTYPDARVQAEIAGWVHLAFDITGQREVAELFEVVAVPVAVAVTASGDELGRIENFVEPADFAARLEALRGKNPDARGNPAASGNSRTR